MMIYILIFELAKVTLPAMPLPFPGILDSQASQVSPTSLAIAH